MKLSTELAENILEGAVTCSPEPAYRGAESEAPAKASAHKHFRRLKWNEVVRRGDYVGDDRLGLELWDGPGGFRADAFLKTIYRRKTIGRLRLTATRKPRGEK